MSFKTAQTKNYQKISKAIKNFSYTLLRNYQNLSKQNKVNQPAIFLKEEKFVLKDLSFLIKQKNPKSQFSPKIDSYLLHSFL